MEELKMRVCSTLSRFFVVLAGLFMVIGLAGTVIATEPASQSPEVVVPEPTTPTNLVSYNEYYVSAGTPTPAQKEAATTTAGNCVPGCDSCSSGCGGRCGHWLVGVEAVWLSPIQDNPIARYQILDDAAAVLYDFDPSTSGADGFYLSPRIWLGYQGECWGVITRYWRMSEPGQQTVLGNDQITDGFAYNNVFEAETFDLEVTRLFCFGETTNQLSFGARYAQLNQTSSVIASQDIGGDIFSGSSFARYNFGGPGITMGLNGLRPLQNRCFNLFYSLRGSLLWDDSTLNAVETRAALTDGAAASSVNGAIASSDGDLFIGELQVGAQWNFELVRHRADAFLRFAFEYQYWHTNDTGFAEAESFAGLLGGDVGVATAQSSNSDVNLVGFNVATGFTW
ncbi:MAG TPA: hypothetical protein VIH42_09060 [Thermoguttaceae bacterium]